MESVIVEMKILFSLQLLIRRLAEHGAEEIEPMFAAEAKVRQSETLKKGDSPVVANLRQRQHQGKARDKAASVVGVLARWQAMQIDLLRNNSNAIQCEKFKRSEHKRK